MKRNLTSILVAVNVLLVGLLAWLWIDPHGGLRGVHWEPPAAIRPDLGSPFLASIGREEADGGRFVAVLDRPLFYPGRRPAPVAKSGSGARSDPLDSIHLFGLFSGSEGGGAIVQVEGKTRRLKVSEALGDWTLKEVRPREVVFARGGENRVVPLVQAKQGGATPAAAAAGARAGGSMPSFPFPMQAPSGVPSFTPQGSLPTAAPPRIDSGPGGPGVPGGPGGPSGNAAAPAPSNAKPGAPSNPFVTGGSR